MQKAEAARDEALSRISTQDSSTAELQKKLEEQDKQLRTDGDKLRADIESEKQKTQELQVRPSVHTPFSPTNCLPNLPSLLSVKCPLLPTGQCWLIKKEMYVSFEPKSD